MGSLVWEDVNPTEWKGAPPITSIEKWWLFHGLSNLADAQQFLKAGSEESMDMKRRRCSIILYKNKLPRKPDPARKPGIFGNSRTMSYRIQVQMYVG